MSSLGQLPFRFDILGTADMGDPTIYDETPESLRPHLADFLKSIEAKSSVFKFNEGQFNDNIDRANKSVTGGVHDPAYVMKKNVRLAYKQFGNGRKYIKYYPVKYGSCFSNKMAVLANGDFVLCCFDYDSFTKVGNIKENKIHDIVDKAMPIIKMLRRPGKLPFEHCGYCLGTPKKFGSVFKNAIGLARILKGS